MYQIFKSLFACHLQTFTYHVLIKITYTSAKSYLFLHAISHNFGTIQIKITFMHSKIKKKTQLIILSACHSCEIIRKVHHHTTSSRRIRISYRDLFKGLGFLNVYLTNNYKQYVG
jgi:hypothetical protein